MARYHFSIELCCLHLVYKLLISAGGKFYQSQIVKHLGFSTSKTSELLGAMEKEGLIKRKIQGREKRYFQ
ncbi:MAG: helix-turn-helix transcriptional regulator [Candidatus Bathycorpusculaceae bacterium]